MKKAITCLLCACLLLPLLVSCANPELKNKLPGTWANDEDAFDFFTFTNSGEWQFGATYSAYRVGHYRVSGNKAILSFEDGTTAFEAMYVGGKLQIVFAAIGESSPHGIYSKIS